MVIQDFSSKTIFLDTAPIIYFIEGNSPYQSILAKLFAYNDSGYFYFSTSAITLLEVLVKPLRENQLVLAQQYRTILTRAPGLEIYPVTSSIAEVAARVRAQYSLKTPDAIQVATALTTGSDYFLTNDKRLKSIPEIEVVTVDELQ